MKTRRYLIWVALAVVLLLTHSINMLGTEESVWPQFRGPDGLGIAIDDHTYPSKLDPSQNLLWKTEVPLGYSSPCVWGDRIFITARSGDSLETICLDRRNGAIKWRKAIKPETFEKINPTNSHASPTPATDGKHVFVYFGSFGLVAYHFDGQEFWRKSLPVPTIRHGSASSPILADGLVIVNCDQEDAPYLLALDRSTGKQVWKRTRPDTKSKWSWSTPVLWKHGNETELVVLGRERLIAYDLKDGQECWWVTGFPIETASTPVYASESVFAAATVAFIGDPVNPIDLPDFKELLERYDSNGDSRLVKSEISEDLAFIYRMGPEHGVKSRFSQFDSDKDDAINEEEWTQIKNNISKMRPRNTDVFVAIRCGGEGNVTESHVQWKVSEGIGQVASPLVYQGRLYLVKHGGNITCFDEQTGERVYGEKIRPRARYIASPVLADGKIYLCSENGVVVVIKAGENFEVLSQNKLGRRIKATPALVGGNIYLRTERHMMAFGDK